MKDFAPFSSEEANKYSRVRTGLAAIAGIATLVGAAFNGWEPVYLYVAGIFLLSAGLSWFFDD